MSESDLHPITQPIVGPLDDFFARFRQDCPVAFTEDKGGIWFLFRREDVVAAARNTSAFGSDIGDGTQHRKPPLELDPPDHTWFRRVLQPHFSPSKLERLEPLIREWSSDLIGPLLQRGQGDAVRDLAAELPGKVLALFLGFPDEMWPDLKHWSDFNSRAKWEGDDRGILEADRRLFDLAANLVASRDLDPKPSGTDLVSDLLEANAAKEDPYPRESITSTVQLLLTAGHGTTATAIANLIYHVASDPDLQHSLRRQPDRVSVAVEESLRVASPVATPRVAKEDIHLGDRLIRKGERVWLVWGSANLDDSNGENAGEISLDREARHLTFGYGIHKCIGLNLARMEMRLMLEVLLGATSSFELAGPVQWESFPRYGLQTLPLQIERQS